ncbi:MAG: DegT/DnrJ/EryC1/StrS family aminotransferase [Deltaproteobacteria bacterium]|nr:DegT/DnrJ/EryC1/StrS family aminotransferase [Deltaproteobacteria bacterium]
MTLIGSVPRRAVNLAPGTLRTLIRHLPGSKAQQGPSIEAFYQAFGQWLGTPHVFGAASGRSAFQLALKSLELKKGAEIIFPIFTFPVMPMVAKILGYRPVFCEVDPVTFNAGPEHIEPKITADTGAVLATHLFGKPCPINEIKALARQRGIRLLEDCAHACGVRVDGKAVGTFGDIGLFSFAEGKNMPCFGGGAIAISDPVIAARAGQILAESAMQSKDEIVKKAISVWLKWLATIPWVFGITMYPALRLKQMLNQPLLDSSVGDDLLYQFERSQPQIKRMSNLQAAVGLVQLRYIDAFNEGARLNGQALTEELGKVKSVTAPPTSDKNNIYVYYPLSVSPEMRDDLRHFLLRHGIDSKITDMSDCSVLTPFQNGRNDDKHREGPSEASILEICVYPMISTAKMRRIGRVIRAWDAAKH